MEKICEFMAWNEAQKNIAAGRVLSKNNQNEIVKSNMKPPTWITHKSTCSAVMNSLKLHKMKFLTS